MKIHDKFGIVAASRRIEAEISKFRAIKRFYDKPPHYDGKKGQQKHRRAGIYPCAAAPGIACKV